MGIVVENITKLDQGYTKLDNVSFEVNDGDFSVLQAPTGSGKTSLLKIIARINKPTSGKIYYSILE